MTLPKAAPPPLLPSPATTRLPGRNLRWPSDEIFMSNCRLLGRDGLLPPLGPLPCCCSSFCWRALTHRRLIMATMATRTTVAPPAAVPIAQAGVSLPPLALLPSSAAAELLVNGDTGGGGCGMIKGGGCIVGTRSGGGAGV